MHKDEIQAERKRLRQVKENAHKGKTRADSFNAVSQSPMYRNYLTGVGPFVDPIVKRSDYLREFSKFENANTATIQALLTEAEELPKASEQKWNAKRNVNIGIIADRFLYESLEVAADFKPITPDNFREVIPSIDVLLVVSAWRGLNEEWINLPRRTSGKRELLEKTIIPFAKSEGVPVVFYSKEDPPNYESFVSIARLADHVFTSAEEMIPRYKKDIPEDIPVEALRFGVNYKVHNPLGSMRHLGREMVFAGSWMSHKYPSRASSTEKMFDAALHAGLPLYVIDRNLDLDPKSFKNLEKYMFPDRFVANLHRPLPHDRLLRLQKLLPLAFNLNSVMGSQTMFANRVVELLAMGTLLISNYSAGVNTRYPSVAIMDTELDTQQFLETLTDDYLRYCQVEGIREVFLNDTAYDRVDTILSSVGIQTPEEEHRILVVANDREEFEQFCKAQATSIECTYVSLGEIGEVTGSEHGDLVIFANRLESFGPDIVNDAIAAYRYSAVDALHITAFDSETPAYEPEDHQNGLAEPATAYWIDAGRKVDDSNVRSSMTIKSSFTCKKAAPRSTKQAELSVIVPAYNNGKHLIHKCCQSIFRSSINDLAKVLIVDDGSTDPKTLAALSLLENTKPNVEVYRFPAGGSGSASRPRNKGLELTQTPYVTYLDPDNEQLNDTYIRLLNRVKDTGADFAIGNMVRFKGKRSRINNARELKKAMAKSPSLNGENADLLQNLEFKPMSIQALVANTAWLKSLNLVQPVGAVGQDSYFFQQMLYYARKISITTRAAHIYYAEISNSTVNAISPKYYRKYLPLERDRAKWLDEIGLLHSYQEGRFNQFLEHWYVKKLENVDTADLDECLALIEEIIGIYGLSEASNPEIQRIMDKARSLKH